MAKAERGESNSVALTKLYRGGVRDEALTKLWNGKPGVA